MGCDGGCLCDACCANARDFAFGHFRLENLVSRSGYWHGMDEPSPRLRLFENQDDVEFPEEAAA